MKIIKQEFQTFDENQRLVMTFFAGAIFGAIYLFTLFQVLL